MEKEALFYEKQGEKISCKLCPHSCVIPAGKHGKCNVRTNRQGKLYTINYGEMTSAARDPIEKSLYITLNQVAIYFLWEALDVILLVDFVKIILYLKGKQEVNIYLRKN